MKYLLDEYVFFHFETCSQKLSLWIRNYDSLWICPGTYNKVQQKVLQPKLEVSAERNYNF